MPEKRPYPGGQGDANGVKRPRPSAVADKIAAAKAAAEAKAREIQARFAPKQAVVNAAPTPPAPPPSAPPPSDSQSRLEALKARMAAMKANKEESESASADPSGPRFATTLGNRRAAESATDSKTNSAGPNPAQPGEVEKVNPYFDAKAAGATRERMTRGLLFNQRGKYLDQASKLRAQSRLEKIKKMLALKARRAGLDENSERGFLVQAPPEVEWWDEGILPETSYDAVQDIQNVKHDRDDSIITAYIQHPPILRAPQDQRLIEVKPMYLTSKEQAKLRRMRRAADAKEHQAKIRLGLEPPPPPKVKRGNMMRVMGEQAIADPTAVEMLVESQIKERHDTHVTANEERKLSKEERQAKLAANQEKDAQKGLYTCVFKINTLAYGKHRYQIDLNAKQLNLTGVTIFNPQLNMVIVEGGIHSIEKYKKLMLNRIKWTENAKPTDTQAEKQAADPDWMKSFDDKGKLKDHSNNKCSLVFEGEVKQRAFRKWGSKRCETDGEARELLARSKLDSLWALAKSSE